MHDLAVGQAGWSRAAGRLRELLLDAKAREARLDAADRVDVARAGARGGPAGVGAAAGGGGRRRRGAGAGGAGGAGPRRPAVRVPARGRARLDRGRCGGRRVLISLSPVSSLPSARREDHALVECRGALGASAARLDARPRGRLLDDVTHADLLGDEEAGQADLARLGPGRRRTAACVSSSLPRRAPMRASKIARASSSGGRDPACSPRGRGGAGLHGRADLRAGRGRVRRPGQRDRAADLRRGGARAAERAVATTARQAHDADRRCAHARRARSSRRGSCRPRATRRYRSRDRR